jgi:hypothetical protein
VRLLLGTLMAVAMGLFGAAVAAAPAQAGSGGELCFPVYDGDQIIGWECVPIDIVACEPPCGLWSMDPHEDIVLPQEIEIEYLNQLGQGMSLVSQAAMERNPDVAKRLLDQAEQAFLSSARTLGDTRISGVDVGLPDLRKNTVLPSKDEWLIAAGTDVGNGIQQMQQALRDPRPEPWIDAGMASFTSGYEHLNWRR